MKQTNKTSTRAKANQLTIEEIKAKTDSPILQALATNIAYPKKQLDSKMFGEFYQIAENFLNMLYNEATAKERGTFTAEQQEANYKEAKQFFACLGKVNGKALSIFSTIETDNDSEKQKQVFVYDYLLYATITTKNIVIDEELASLKCKRTTANGQAKKALENGNIDEYKKAKETAKKLTAKIDKLNATKANATKDIETKASVSKFAKVLQKVLQKLLANRLVMSSEEIEAEKQAKREKRNNSKKNKNGKKQANKNKNGKQATETETATETAEQVA